LRQKQR